MSHVICFTDLVMVADAACELDAYKDHLHGSSERDRIKRLVDALHRMVERVAGADANLIYAPDDATPAATAAAGTECERSDA